MHLLASHIRLFFRPLIGAIFLLLLLGCNTPRQRISKNPQLFASYPRSVQELIRAGEEDIVFTPGMVMMAVGTPNRSYLRTTQEGESEVWAYTAYKFEYERQLVDASFRYKDSNGITRSGRDKVWANVKTKIEYDTLRVELRGERVVAVERVD